VITLRRALTALAVATGLLAVTAGPASAGIVMSNHCPPPALPADLDGRP
jgi:hypothetical protein